MYVRAKRKGFTIVELLIVIVVIAILATISVVAYSGIQHRASDTAVQNDLSRLKKKLEIFYIDNGRYPATNASSIAPLRFNAAKAAYETNTTYNLLYCQPYSVSTQQYSLLALSKSGTIFRISNDSAGVAKYTGTWQSNQADTCVDAGSPAGTGSHNYRGYAPDDTVEGPWRPWVGGN